MDIRNVRNIFPPIASATPDVKSRSTTDATKDREGNGQSAGDEQKKRRHLSPEEIEDAVKHLSALPGVKDHGLTVRVETTEDIVVVFIEDREGKVVRRIPEADLSLLNLSADRKSGHLLNKAG